MFKRLDHTALAKFEAPVVRIMINGLPAECRAGDSVAAALFANGYTACRQTVVEGRARGPFCMMGVCYDCLITIDGQPNRQACMTPAREGMCVQWQDGAREIL